MSPVPPMTMVVEVVDFEAGYGSVCWVLLSPFGSRWNIVGRVELESRMVLICVLC